MKNVLESGASVEYPDITITVPKGYRSLSVTDCRGLDQEACDLLGRTRYAQRYYTELADEIFLYGLPIVLILLVSYYLWITWFAVGTVWE